MLASILLPTLFIVSAAPQERLVAGLAVVSNDVAITRRAAKVYIYNMPFKELEAEFSQGRFSVRPWGLRSAIVLDRKSGPLGEKLALNSFLQAVLNEGKDSLALVWDKCSPEARTAISDLLQNLQGPTTGWSTDVVKRGSVGLAMTSVVQIRPRDGAAVTLSIPVRNPRTEERTRILEAHPAPPRVPDLSDPAKAERAKSEALEFLLQRDRINVSYFGIGKSNAGESLREIGKALDDELAAAEMATSATALALLRGFSANGAAPFLGDSTEFASLSPQTQEQLLKHAKQSYAGLGLGSAAEAEGLLLNSASLKVSTGFGLMFCIQPHDPGSRIPGSFGSFILFNLPGYLPPSP